MFKPGQSGNPSGGNAHKRLSQRRAKNFAEAAAKQGIMPLEYMLQILRDEKAPKMMRYMAAKDAAPYLHPRLAQIDHNVEKNVIYHIADKPMTLDEWAKEFAGVDAPTGTTNSVN